MIFERRFPFWRCPSHYLILMAISTLGFLLGASPARASCDADPFFSGARKGLIATQSKPMSKNDFDRQMVLLRRVAANLKHAKEMGDVDCRGVSNDEMISWDDRIAAAGMVVYIVNQIGVYHAWLVANTVQALSLPSVQRGGGCHNYVLAVGKSDIADSWTKLADAAAPMTSAKNIPPVQDVDLATSALQRVARTFGMSLPDMTLGSAALASYSKKYATQEATIGATAPTDCVASDYDWL